MGVSAKLKSLSGVARTIWRDPQRKSAPRMLAEVGALGVSARSIPSHYFTNLIYKRDAGDYRNYIGRRELSALRRGFLDTNERDMDLLDKVRFSALAVEHGVPVPTTVAVVVDGVADFGTDTQPAQDAIQLTEVLRRSRATTSKGAIFVKRTDGHSGQGAHLLDSEASSGDVERVAAAMVGGAYLVQEALEQHAEVGRVNPSAINCVRLHTARVGEGPPRVLSAFMRFGRSGSVVDGPSRGGVFVKVDVETGRCVGRARTLLVPGGGREFDVHPDTGVKFDGLMLPDWQAAVSVCLHAAEVFRRPVVGWDVAFTTDGPVIPEGNGNFHLWLAQIAEGGLRTSAFWEVLEPHLKD